MVNARTRFWNILSETTNDMYYGQAYYNRLSSRSTVVRLAAAVAGCGAVAALMASTNPWVKFAACLVAALGQVANAALPVLGYENQLRLLQDMLSRLSVLSLQMEREWYRIDDEKLTHDELIRMCVYYDGLHTSIVQQVSPCGLEFDDDLTKKAEDYTATYLANLHPVDQDEAEPQQDA